MARPRMSAPTRSDPWHKVADHLVRKSSIPYNHNRPLQPQKASDAHNKLVVTDDIVVTGSFNLFV